MKPILQLFCIAAFISLSVNLAVAQNDREAAVAAAGDKYVISAKAGGVNYVEGNVTVVRKDGSSGRVLRRDEINIGDRVSTGADGKAEILLNPGSYMRIGSNTDFEFKTTSLDNLQIRLDKGNAIFEVFASHEFTVRVTTPKAKFLLIESGVFRIDAMADGSARVAVWQGRALLSDHIASLIKKGQVAILKDGSSSIGKLSGRDTDDFEAWSKSRGKDLAKQSAKLKNQNVRNSLLNSFNGGRWGMYSSFGLWVWDPFWGGYCFLPFGQDWRSPYGFGYGNSIWGYNLPPNVYNPPIRVGGGTSPTQSITPILSGGTRGAVPPFERIRGVYGNSGASPQLGDPGETRRSGSGGEYTPYTPSIRSTPATPITTVPITSVPAETAPASSSPRSPIKPGSNN